MEKKREFNYWGNNIPIKKRYNMKSEKKLNKKLLVTHVIGENHEIKCTVVTPPTKLKFKITKINQNGGGLIC